MLYTCIFLLLSIWEFAYFYKPQRRNIFTLLLTAFPVLIGVGAIMYYNSGIYTYELTLYPFVVFAAINFILIKWISGGLEVDTLSFERNTLLKKISIVYIIATVFYALTIGRRALNTYLSGAYLVAYLESHEEGFSFHTNAFEQILINYTEYLKIPVLLFGFFSLTKEQKGARYLGILSILSVLLCRIIWSVNTSSRTDLFMLIILVFVCYKIFEYSLPEKLNKYIRRILFLVGVVISFLGIAISASRFEDKELSSWIYDYFGASVVDFHDIIVSTTQNSNGRYFLGFFSSILPVNFQRSIMTRDIGSGFATLYGQLYMDFGWMFLFLFIIPIIAKPIVRRRPLKVEDLYVTMTYFITVFMANLYPMFALISFVMTIGVYYLLKYGSK